MEQDPFLHVARRVLLSVWMRSEVLVGGSLDAAMLVEGCAG